jgi:hypothetical protein
MFNKLLDDPKVPIWRIEEMYAGISEDKQTLSTAKLAEKYGMTETRITGIIKANCYQDE